MRCLEEALFSLQDICSTAAKALPVPGQCLDSDATEDFEEALRFDRKCKDSHSSAAYEGHIIWPAAAAPQAMEDLRKEFSAAVSQNSLSGEIMSFALATCTIASGTSMITRRCASAQRCVVGSLPLIVDYQSGRGN